MSSPKLPTPSIDDDLLRMGLSLTPAQRLDWLESAVEELLPWVGLAAEGEPSHPERSEGEDSERVSEHRSG